MFLIILMGCTDQFLVLKMAPIQFCYMYCSVAQLGNKIIVFHERLTQ